MTFKLFFDIKKYYSQKNFYMNEKKQEKIKIPFQITVRELALRLNIEVSVVIKKLMENGIMATINEAIDYETAVYPGNPHLRNGAVKGYAG